MLSNPLPERCLRYGTCLKVGVEITPPLPEDPLSPDGATMERPDVPSSHDPLSRRSFLKRATGTSLTLAAASALSPFLLSGCKGSKGNTIKVGILHSLTGTMAISETALRDVEQMAIAEINDAGGVLGKKIESIVEDGESKFTTVFPEKARKLLLKDE